MNQCWQNGKPWDSSAEILASSMRLVSISDTRHSSYGLSPHPSSISSCNSGSSGGLGSSLSRTSYTTNLSSLAINSNAAKASSPPLSTNEMNRTTGACDDWGYGYYVDPNPNGF